MKAEFKTAVIFGMVIATAIGVLSITFTSLDDATVEKTSFRTAPDLAGIAHYLNTTPEQLAQDMEGRVVLYDIWTYSCINCIRTLPHITAWHDKYHDDGLLIIGVHSPEFEFEKDLGNVQNAVDRHGIEYPVVMDNDWETWKAFENRYWPRKYIADHEGYIRYDHIGEGAYRETERIIQELLGERTQALGLREVSATPLVDIDGFEHTRFMTPELYFGYKFAQGRDQLGNEEGFRPGNTTAYSIPPDMQLHKFYLEGSWRSTPDSMQLESDSGTIALHYNAKQVNIVASGDARVEAFVDGEPLPAGYGGMDVVSGNQISVGGPGLYNVINGDSPSSHVLELKVSGGEFQIFTFTFG